MIFVSAWVLTVVSSMPWGSPVGPVDEDMKSAIQAAESRLLEVRARLEALRTSAAEQRQGQLDRLQALGAEQSREEDALAADRSAIDSLRKEIGTLSGKKRELEDERAELDAQVGVRADEIVDRLTGSLIAVENPSWAERRLDEALPLSTRLAELLDWAADEVRVGAVSSRFQGRVVTPSGQKGQGDILRVGLVEAFLASEGGHFSLLPLSSSLDWRGMKLGDSERESRVGDVFRALDNGESGNAELPLDTSGGLAVWKEGSGRTLEESFEAGGPVMYPLAALAILSLLLFVERLIYLGGAARRANRVIDPVRRLTRDGQFDEAKNLLLKTGGPAARIMGACIDLRRAPAEVIDRGVEEAMLAELPRIERSMGTLGTFGAIAPFLGLLGTITGMITTFNVITASGRNDPTLLSSGISEALLTTQAGLIVAIPILLLHTFLTGRADSLIARIEQGLAGVMATFEPDAEVEDEEPVDEPEAP